jgi:hypothetical protein
VSPLTGDRQFESISLKRRVARHRGEAHRVSRLAHVEQPGVTEALAAIGEIGLVGEHQEVAMGEQLGPSRIADVEHGEPAVVPSGIGEVAGDESVVQRVSPALRPTRRLAPPVHMPGIHHLPTTSGRVGSTMSTITSTWSVNSG